MKPFYVAILAALTLLSAVNAETYMIVDADGETTVPAYYWWAGCGPTAAGMVIGYWDGQGFDNLVEGTAVWDEGNMLASTKVAIRKMIASPGYFEDYHPTPDRYPTTESPLHEDDSVADFMMTSRGFLGTGVSFTSYQYRGMSGYADYRGYPLSAGGQIPYEQLWDRLIVELRAERPMELYVDSDGDGQGDHYVVALGYENDGDVRRVAVHNSYDYDVHWLDFIPISAGTEWGFGSGIWFNLFTEQEAGWGNGGDISGDGAVLGNDVDLLHQAFATGEYSSQHDVNMDGLLNDSDLWMLVDHLLDIQGHEGVRGTIYGDINLDGAVDVQDFVILKQNYGGSGGWSQGDSDGNFVINIMDFVTIKQNYGKSIWSSTGAAAPLPEPTGFAMLTAGTLALLKRRRSR